MKTRYLVLFILISTIACNSFAQKTQFYIKSTVGGLYPKEIEGLPTYFATLFDNYLKEKYSCTTVLTTSDVGYLLGWERQRQLLGSGSEETIKSISDALGVDYLVSFEVSVAVGEKFIVNGTIIPMRVKPVFPLVKASAYSNYSKKSFDQIDANLKEVAQKLIDGLKKIEICPFKGEITVKVVSTKKDDQTEQYPVYCNGIDGYFKKTTTLDNYSEIDWTLRKVARNSSTGNVKINISEELKIDEDNPCYECSPQKQGHRSFIEKTTTYADIKGLSTESESKGIKIDDARCYLTFLDDGTYTIRVTAASKQGDKKTIKEMSAQGICDNINESPKKTNNKIDAGLNEIWGPFNGDTQDKILSHKDTITRTNAAGEEETITYEFNLTRD
ncbi:MAG TPA: hypothetical protein DHV28_12685 [Ignavibacteriales bacterium]|nr:hypothetical protein [Ignavibacteriales bacterium]